MPNPPPCPKCGGQPTAETLRFDGTPLYLDKCGSWYEGQEKVDIVKEKPVRKKKPKIDLNPKLVRVR